MRYLAFVTLLTFVSTASAQEWSVEADVAESCSCNLPCPCNFGSKHTHDYCEGTRLIEIKKGHWGDVSLDDVTLAVTFRMNEWSKVYVDESADDAQMSALEELMPLAFRGFHRWGIESMERAPITVERTDEILEYDMPDNSVAIKVMKGMDERPVTILNLPSSSFIDYMQYRTVHNEHRSRGKEFRHEGTNGFTSKMKASGRE